MAKNGKCKAGYYYCYTDKKCKPIPAGFKVVGRAGMLRKENGHSVDDESETDTKKNGNSGNGETVSEEGLRDWFGRSKSKDGKKGWVNVVTGDSCASDKPGEGIPKCVSSSKRASMSKKERVAAQAAKRREDPGQQKKSGASKPTNVKTDRKVKEDMDINEAKDKKGKGSGSKDACYHKVKSRYSVWPSAYASGALVKCRKVGAANWGNSTKKEEYMALPEFSDIQIKAMRAAGVEVEVIDEKCWKGYEKKGMKTMFGKRYPNCVKKEEVTCMGSKKGEECPIHGKKECPTLEEATRIPPKTGNIFLISFSWRGKYMNMKLFFPEVRKPTRNEIQDALDKFYPGCNLLRFDTTTFQPSDSVLNVGVSEEVDTTDWKDDYVPMEIESTDLIKPEPLQEKSAAWQRKEGKNPEGGLNEKGRKSYERENPGSDLKAPQPEGGPRKRSFCARMGGMKGPMKDEKGRPTRKALALRKWKC